MPVSVAGLRSAGDPGEPTIAGASRGARDVRALHREPAREDDRERRACPERAVHADPAAAALDDPAHDPEAQTEAFAIMRGCSALEALEDLIELVRRDSGAVVADDEAHRCFVCVEAHLDRLPAAVADRVREQVAQDLL